MLLSLSTSAVAPKAPVMRRNERRLVFMGEILLLMRYVHIAGEGYRIRGMKKYSIALVAVAALCTGLAASASARINSSELRRDLAVAANGSEGGQDRVDFGVIEKIRAEG